MNAQREYENRIRLAAEVVERAKVKSQNYVGSCDDCKWVRGSEMFLNRSCANPIVQSEAFNVTCTYARNRIQKVSEQRDERSNYGEALCGPLGVLFEPRMTLWRWLFG